MKPLYLSPSKIADYETCGYAYARKHIDRWREEVDAHSLAFGGAIDEACDAHIRGLINGNVVDPVEVFDREWDLALQRSMAFNKTHDENSLRSMGRVLMERFPAAWAATGYSVVVDPQGEPVMQRNLEIELPNRVVLRTKLDLLVNTPHGTIANIDLKTAASRYPEYLTPLSEQLTAYQIAVDAHAPSLGIAQVDEVGFIEMLKRAVPKTKRGEGPTVEAPILAPRRPDAVIAEFLQKVQWIAEDIRRGRFPRRPRMGFNSPCGLCYLRDHCGSADDSGIVKPNTQQQFTLPHAA
jgi:hypothetical protein